MLAPEIVAALITSGSGLLPDIFKGKSGGPAPQQGGSDQPPLVHYDVLRSMLTDNCVAILRRLESGMNLPRSALVSVVYPKLHEGEKKRLLTREFSYRMDYLTLLGLISRVRSEYTITELGLAFLQEARIRKHYGKVLFG